MAAGVAADEVELERVGVEAADRRQAPLERLRREGPAVGLGFVEIRGEMMAADLEDVDLVHRAPDEEPGEVAGIRGPGVR